MFNYQNFDDVFDFDPEYSYDSDSIRAIETHRKEFEGLFIDRILKILGIKRPLKHYPPKSNNSLKDLHKTICDAVTGENHKVSILYYILLDIDHPTGKREFSTAFEEKTFLPQKYVIYIKGLWHFDHQEYEAALQYLTHPSLHTDFADEILETLVRKCKDPAYALSYYHSAKPVLKTAASIECLFTSIAKTSVTEAFFFAREQSIFAHRHLFEILISNVLHNSPSDQVVNRATELVKLPMAVQEEEWFDEYLTRGDGTRHPKAKDTVLMRKIGTGKFAEGLEMKNVHGRNIGGLDWNVLAAGVKHGMGPRSDL